MGEHHALRRAGRARGEDELEDLVGGRALPGALARLPVGRERRVIRRGLGRERLDGRRREVVQPGFARVGRVAPGPEDEVPGSGRLDDPLDRRRRHPKVERDEDEPRSHRAVVRGGELGCGRGPGEDAVTGFEAHGPQPPRRDPAAPLELAEAPLARGPVVAPQGECRPFPVAHDRGVEQVEQCGHPDVVLPLRGRHPTTEGVARRLDPVTRGDTDRVPCIRNDHRSTCSMLGTSEIPPREWC